MEIWSLLLQIRKLRQRGRLIFRMLQKGLKFLTRPLFCSSLGCCACPHLSCLGGAGLGYVGLCLCGGGWVQSSTVCPSPPTHLALGLCLQSCLHLPWQQSEMAWTLPLSKRNQCPAQVLPQLLQFRTLLDSKTMASEPLPPIFVFTLWD